MIGTLTNIRLYISTSEFCCGLLEGTVHLFLSTPFPSEDFWRKKKIKNSPNPKSCSADLLSYQLSWHEDAVPQPYPQSFQMVFIREISHFAGQQTTNFYSKYIKRFWATCSTPKKLEIHLKINLGINFSCFHSFSQLREARSWKCLQYQALELSSIRASLSTAKQGYTKK